MTRPPYKSSGVRARPRAVVVVDSVAATRARIRNALEAAGLEVLEATNAFDLHALLAQVATDEAIAEAMVLVMREPEPLVERLWIDRLRECGISLVAITAFGPPEAAARAAELGAATILDEPLDLERCQLEVAELVGRGPVAPADVAERDQ